MVGSVPTHLSQTPGSGSPDTFVFISECLSEGVDTLGLDNTLSQSFIKGRDVADRDNPWQSLTLSVRNKIDYGYCPS